MALNFRMHVVRTILGQFGVGRALALTADRARWAEASTTSADAPDELFDNSLGEPAKTHPSPSLMSIRTCTLAAAFHAAIGVPKAVELGLQRAHGVARERGGLADGEAGEKVGLRPRRAFGGAGLGPGRSAGEGGKVEGLGFRRRLGGLRGGGELVEVQFLRLGLGRKLRRRFRRRRGLGRRGLRRLGRRLRFGRRRRRRRGGFGRRQRFGRGRLRFWLPAPAPGRPAFGRSAPSPPSPPGAHRRRGRW